MQADESFSAYSEKLFISDTKDVPQLRSTMDNEQYLEAISAPRTDGNGRKKRPVRRPVQEEDSDDSDVPEETQTVRQEQPAMSGTNGA